MIILGCVKVKSSRTNAPSGLRRTSRRDANAICFGATNFTGRVFCCYNFLNLSWESIFLISLIIRFIVFRVGNLKFWVDVANKICFSRTFLKICDCDLIFGHAVKTISSLVVRSPCKYLFNQVDIHICLRISWKISFLQQKSVHSEQ